MGGVQPRHSGALCHIAVVTRRRPLAISLAAVSGAAMLMLEQLRLLLSMISCQLFVCLMSPQGFFEVRKSLAGCLIHEQLIALSICSTNIESSDETVQKAVSSHATIRSFRPA